MSATKKTRSVIFRVTDEEWQRIEAAAEKTGQEVNEWSRKVTLAQALAPTAMSPTERLLYEELASLRYLLGHGFGLLSKEQLTNQAWETVRTTADQKLAQIADALLARRSKGDKS